MDDGNSYRECTLPGAEYDSEWCREYCPLYERKVCRYDRDTKKMWVIIPTED